MAGVDFNYMINTGYWPAVVRKSLLALSVFLGIFYFYRKGRSFGFNREKLLDLAVFPLASALLIYNALTPFKNLRLGLSFLSFILMLSYQTKKLSWSYPRILDIASESTSLSLIFLPVGSLIFNLVFLVQFIFLRCISVFSPKVGLVSYLFLIFFSASVFIIEYLNRHLVSFNTIFAFAILFTSLIRLKNEGYFIEIVRLSTLGIHPLGSLVIILNKLKGLSLVRFRRYDMNQNGNYLDATEVKKLKESLLRKEKELDEAEKNLKSEDLLFEPGRDMGNAEEQDGALEQTEHERTLVIISETKKSKEDVVNALRKFDQGKYGYCEKCSSLIDKARLEAYPEARLCMICSEKL